MKKLSLTLAALVLAASPAFAWNHDHDSAPSHCGYNHYNDDGSDFAAVQNAVPYTVGPTSVDTGWPNTLPGPAWVPYLNTNITASRDFPDLWVTLSANSHIMLAAGGATSNIAWQQVRLLVDGNPVPFAGAQTDIFLDALVTELLTSPLGFDNQELSMKSMTWSIPGVGYGSHTLEVDVRFWFHPTGTPLPRAESIFGPANLTAQSVNLN